MSHHVIGVAYLIRGGHRQVQPITLAVRGYGSHGEKIVNIIKKFNNILKVVYLPRSIETWAEIGAKDPINGVIIASPNITHLDYSEAAINAFPNAYIYCEKPFINQHEYIKKAHELIASGRIMLGFNLRSSCVNDRIQDLSSKFALGSVTSLRIFIAYPFALRDLYQSSWKSKINYSPHGVVENLAVHYIDLVNFLYKIKSIACINSGFLQAVPTTTDILARLHNGATANMHFSYSETAESNITINFKNGSIVFSQDECKVIAPLLNIVFIGYDGIEKIFQDSLRSSLGSFVSEVIARGSHYSESTPCGNHKDHEYIDIMGQLLVL
jgi:predicted dehydrogenase